MTKVTDYLNLHVAGFSTPLAPAGASTHIQPHPLYCCNKTEVIFSPGRTCLNTFIRWDKHASSGRRKYLIHQEEELFSFSFNLPFDLEIMTCYWLVTGVMSGSDSEWGCVFIPPWWTEARYRKWASAYSYSFKHTILHSGKLTAWETSCEWALCSAQVTQLQWSPLACHYYLHTKGQHQMAVLR